MIDYTPEVESQMQFFYQSLSEKDKRRYAAIEAMKLGYGGKKYICQLFGCHFKTLENGLKDFDEISLLFESRQRKEGGGRKKVIEIKDGIEDAFLEIISDHTAGSPMDGQVKWTNLSRPQIAEYLREKGFSVSVPVVAQLLKKHNFRKRKPFKSLAGGKSEFRDEQFKNIKRLKEENLKKGNPVLSMDVKKKN